jgi:hypothetical protein
MPMSNESLRIPLTSTANVLSDGLMLSTESAGCDVVLLFQELLSLDVVISS